MLRTRQLFTPTAVLSWLRCLEQRWTLKVWESPLDAAYGAS